MLSSMSSFYLLLNILQFVHEHSKKFGINNCQNIGLLAVLNISHRNQKCLILKKNFTHIISMKSFQIHYL